MKRSLFVIACAVLAAACENGNVVAPQQGPALAAKAPSTVQLGVPFELANGQTVTVSGEALTVQFDGVTSDSRCPTGVQCVWAGNATVRLILSKGGKAAGVELNTNLDPKSADYLEYNVELLGLAPYPSSKGGPISQSQYRATLVVRKNTVVASAPVLGSPFDLNVGSSATVQNEGLTVTFDTVLSDSRCPTDVNCFWEGNAEVQVTLSKSGYASQTVVLNTSLSPQSVAYAGYTVTLNDLNPDPVSTSTIDPSSYVANFTVTKP